LGVFNEYCEVAQGFHDEGKEKRTYHGIKDELYAKSSVKAGKRAGQARQKKITKFGRARGGKTKREKMEARSASLSREMGEKGGG